jgi:hypothetical protein
MALEISSPSSIGSIGPQVTSPAAPSPQLQAVEKTVRVADTVFRLIGLGKAKEVYGSEGSPHAYMIPVPERFFHSKRSELQQEVKTADELRKRLLPLLVEDLVVLFPGEEHGDHALRAEIVQALIENSGVLPEGAAARVRGASAHLSGAHLAIDLSEAPPAEGISGQYTVKTRKAETDLEKQIREPLSRRERLQFCVEATAGFRDLHRGDYIHGDPKPENAIIVGGVLRLSDFGKTRLADGNVGYTGNPRFMAPEKTCSKEAEVYATGLFLIRILEEEFLPPDQGAMLVQPTVKHPSLSAETKRRGIERFVVENRDCPQHEGSPAARVAVAWANRVGTSKGPDRAATEREVHRYIDALVARIEVDSPEAACQIEGVLKAMTRSEPALRLTMDQVVRLLEQAKIQVT